MARIELDPASIMIGRAESAVAREQDATIRVVREIIQDGNTTSSEIGAHIEAWEALSLQERNGELSIEGSHSLDRIANYMNGVFGHEGVVQVLRAWYDPIAEGKRAEARELATAQGI